MRDEGLVAGLVHAFGAFGTAASLAARERGSAGLCVLVDEIQAAPVAELETMFRARWAKAGRQGDRRVRDDRLVPGRATGAGGNGALSYTLGFADFVREESTG